MNTVATAPETRKTVRKPRPKPTRFCRFCRISREQGGDFLVLKTVRLRSADVFALYRVEAFLSECGGKGIELTKTDGTRYYVNLDGAASTCDCKGFMSHGHCKHTESLLTLAAAGKL